MPPPNWRSGPRRDPLVVWGDILVDGHNRFKICTAHGVEYETRPMVAEDRRAVRIWIIKNQFSRRNLDTPTRLALGFLMADDLEAQAKERQAATQFGGPARAKLPEPETSPEPRPRDIIAEATGCSPRTVQAYKRVRDEVDALDAELWRVRLALK